MTSLEVIKDLCDKNGITISALEKELSYGNGSLAKAKKLPADRVLEISKYFDVPMEYIMTGDDKSIRKRGLKPKDKKDINSILANTEQLLKQDGLMFDGDPASPEAIESILSAMLVGMEMAKKKNKEKYTPKKYKKD